MYELVGLYFNMFESCYCIIFQPSFLAEYKSFLEQPESAESAFLLQLSLVLAAAGRVHSDADVRHDIAGKFQNWIHISQTWLSAPLEKDRLTLKSIQVQCLLLLCRQIYYVGADLVWISTGSLMRMAMHMGLHVDPDHLGEMNELQKQIRRRLWYTILEMNVQAALDSGMSPMIHDGDYNTQPPSNVSDRDLLHTTGQQQEEALDGLFESSNQSSLQSILAESLPLRLEVTRLINSLQDEPTYDHILTIGKELALASGEVTANLDRATSRINDLPARQFTQSHCSHLIRRFTLCLHFVYAIKSKRNPLYSHSQKVCLEAALDIISLLDDGLYSRLLLSGGGMFRDISTRAAILIFLELSSDAEAEVSSLTKRRYREHQGRLLQYAQRLVQYAEDRVREGETSVKTYVYLRLMMAHAEARFKDSSFTENDMKEILREGFDKCQTMLKDRLANVSKINVYDDSWTLNEANDTSYSEFQTDYLGIANEVNIDFDFLSDQLPSQWMDQNWF
ncbi:hypothetical protein ZTR_05751 [Talaromyces verruculosus]|nr:hypothetical protein ZTR_05751 [Talaromyces verruculosus]